MPISAGHQCRRVAHLAAVLQVLDRGAEDLGAGMQAVERRDAQVLQPARGGADDHDLAGELVGGARALRLVEVLVQVAEGDAREAAPWRRARRARCRPRRAPDSRGRRRRAPAATAPASRGSFRAAHSAGRRRPRPRRKPIRPTRHCSGGSTIGGTSAARASGSASLPRATPISGAISVMGTPRASPVAGRRSSGK